MPLFRLFCSLCVRQVFSYLALKQAKFLCFFFFFYIISDWGGGRKVSILRECIETKDAIPFPSSKANGRDAAGQLLQSKFVFLNSVVSQGIWKVLSL